MKKLIKGLLHAIAPQTMTAFMSARARAHSHKISKEWGCTSLNEKLISQFGNSVQDGPFSGLYLSPMTYAEHLGPYLLGVYESELDPAWDIVLKGAYSQIVDIGAKFGYYAIGLARRFPNASVVAFDTDWWARIAVDEMAKANGVSNVAITSFCTPAWLRENLCENAFVISDCEGYESVLFDISISDKLTSTTLIIETHDFIVPGVTDRLQDTFKRTHDVHVLGDGKIRRVKTHGMEFLSPSEKILANHEVREAQVWLLCVPNE